MNKLRLIALVLLLYVPFHVNAQYYSDRPLEMTFEHSDMFFTPSFINPLGEGPFRQASVLTSSHPLSALQRNPADAGSFSKDTISGNFLYLDFGSRHTTERGYGGVYPMYSYRMPGHWYYNAPRNNELTPMLSAAWLSRPAVMNNKLVLGASYQLISQGEHYYAIPQDIYKNQAGRALDGSMYAGMEGYQVTDRYSGADEMYHEGHSLNAFASWSLSDKWSVGAKVGRFLFERDGSVGSNNLWTQRADYQSYWKTFENREQNYGHWDFSLGVVYASGVSRLGLQLGLLAGEATQLMGRDEDSKSLYGEPASSQYSQYESWYLSDQSWTHTGRTMYGSLLWEKPLREDLGFRLMYNYSRLMTDIGLSSSIESESVNEYKYYYGETNWSESEGFSKMHDFRNGSGEREVTLNRLGAALNWQLTDRQKLSLAAIFSVRNQETVTSELVDAYAEYYSAWQSLYQNGSHYESEYYTKTVEDKTINWTYTTRMRTIQLPVIYEFSAGERFEVLAGISRVMNFWKTENQTLVLYDYRERVNNEQTIIEHKTGERITEPRERMSVINTSLIAGASFMPSPLFRIQLVVSPGLEKNSLVNEYTGSLHVMLGMGLRLTP